MAFEAVRITTTRNGITPVIGSRDDLAQGDVIVASLTSMLGVSSIRWELIGRPEYSVAGGAGSNPWQLAVAASASFTVDNDIGAVRVDGSYDLQATINPGTPGEVRKTVILCRNSGLTIPGVSTPRPLRKLGHFESQEDTISIPDVIQGWAVMLNRWLEALRIGFGGGLGQQTLAVTYQVGTVAADQTLDLRDTDGGGIVIDGSNVGFTGALSLRVNAAAGGPVVIERATSRVGIGTATPTKEITIAAAAPTVRLSRSGGANVDLANISDNLDLFSGATLMGRFLAAGGLRVDFGMGAGINPPAGPGIALAGGGSLPVSAASSGRIRYNPALQRLERSENTGAWRGFGDLYPRVATIADLAGLDASGYQSTDMHMCEVVSVFDAFLHRPTGGRGTWDSGTAYAIGDLVFHSGKAWLAIQAGTNNTPASSPTFWSISMTRIPTAVGTGLWDRIGIESPTYQAQTVFAIDPANVSGVADDENLGYGVDVAAARLVPLRSMAEWRRRVRGAQFVRDVMRHIDIMSTSTVEDDAHIDGFSTGRGLSGPIVMAGAQTVLFSGTVTAYQQGNIGNGRHLITDSAIPTSWTASGGVTTTSGSRYIRKVGGTIHAALLRDMGSKTVQIGPAVTYSATPSMSVTGGQTVFQVGDAYEVVSVPRWPGMMTMGAQLNVRLMCLDISSTATILLSSGVINDWTYCGFLTSVSFLGRNVCRGCVFVGPSVTGIGISNFFNSFLNTLVQWGPGETANWNLQEGVFVNTSLRLWHAGRLDGGGQLRMYDNTTACLSVRHGGYVERVGISGEGNTGLLLEVDTGGRVKMDVSFQAGFTAVTTNARPIVIDGVAYQVAAMAVSNDDTGGVVNL